MSQNTLLRLCVIWVSKNITQIASNGTNISSLPEDIKDKLIVQMLHSNLLNNETLQLFLSPSQKHLGLNDGGNLSVDCFKSVARCCSGLQSLSLANCTQLTTKELTDIVTACTELCAISVRGCTRLDDESLRVISANCKNLVYLDLFGVNKLTNQGIQHLVDGGNMDKLEFISLGDCSKIGNAALQSLSVLPNIREVNLVRCPLIKDNGLVPLVNGPAGKSLQIVDVSHCGGILDQGLNNIAGMTQLRTLSLAGMMRITSEGVSVIAQKCTNLESLSISTCRQLTDAAVASIFANCKNLSVLDISFLEQLTYPVA